jgi:hypothetical protein
MKSVKTLYSVPIFAVSFAGCVATVTTEPVAPVAEVDVDVGYVEPSATVEVAYVEPASYVYISPEVQVIEGYEYPVFFHAGLYYRNDGGVWYSSSYHDRGWVTSVGTPTYIASIHEPHAYVNFHANVNARVGEPGYRAPQRPVVNHSGPPPRYVEQPGHPVRGNNVPGRTPRNSAPPSHNAATHTPPGHTNTPPGHTNTPPGHTNTPPGHTNTPPGHTNTPPANTKHAPPPPQHVPPPRPADKDKKKK